MTKNFYNKKCFQFKKHANFISLSTFKPIFNLCFFKRTHSNPCARSMYPLLSKIIDGNIAPCTGITMCAFKKTQIEYRFEST